MELRVKKTGEIIDVEGTDASNGRISLWDRINHRELVYNSLVELNEELEDYEEPKVAYWIDGQGDVCCFSDTKADDWHKEKAIGNYFKTQEEAEKAVEKLKAWQRLKEKEVKFEGWKRDERYCGDYTIKMTDQFTCDDKDLDLLFGGEDE